MERERGHISAILISLWHWDEGEMRPRKNGGGEDEVHGGGYLRDIDSENNGREGEGVTRGDAGIVDGWVEWVT